MDNVEMQPNDELAEDLSEQDLDEVGGGLSGNLCY